MPTGTLGDHGLDKRPNYLLIEYKQNTMSEKEKCSNTAAASREIKCSFMFDF